MVGPQRKCCLLDTLVRRYYAPEPYAITVLDDDQFQELMDLKLCQVTYPEGKQILESTLAAEVIALQCGPELYREVKSVFDVSQLSEHGNNFLEIVLSSGWFMVDPSWEDDILVIFRHRDAVDTCHYWKFFEDPRAFVLDSLTSHLVTTIMWHRQHHSARPAVKAEPTVLAYNNKAEPSTTDANPRTPSPPPDDSRTNSPALDARDDGTDPMM